MANKVPLVIADFETQLASAISIGATSFTIASATDDDGETLPAGLYCFTVNNGASNKQYLLGQLNGTTVSSVVTVSRQGVESSGAEYAARAGSPVIISDFATIQRVADVLRGQVDLDNANPIGYDAEPTLASRADLATVGYVLDNVTGGTVAFDSQVVTANAGETVAAGDLVYFSTSDQEWYKTDADTAATVENVQIGIALGSGTNGASISGGVQISGTYTTTGLTAGSIYYASNTAGAYATTAGTTERAIGIALSSTKLLIIPRTPLSIRDNEKAALAGGGDLGTPSATNKYTTEKYSSHGRKTVTAGATINGATLPVPVYQNKTDNEFYACDANDTSAMKFLGFAVTNGTDGNDIDVVFAGVVSGFTGLSEGEKYYVQDTVGTIGTSPGTNEILVGIAISETELVVQKGTRRSAGEVNLSSVTGTSSSAITLGFRPSVVRITGLFEAGISEFSSMFLTWTNSAVSAVAHAVTTSNGATVLAEPRLYDTADNTLSNYLTFSITSVTDTGFTITYTETGSVGGSEDRYIFWEAEGDL